jgi:hypothetical protein
VSTVPPSGDDAVDRFLDALLPALRGTPRDVRRALAECEGHLRDDTSRRIEAGVGADEAAVQAVAAFGDAQDIAAGFNRAHRPAALRVLLAEAPLRLGRVVAVGLLAIGASGLVAWLWSAAAGLPRTFGDAPGVHYDGASCAHFLAVHPGAPSCATAALLEVRDDTLFQRAAAGVLGLLLVAGSLWWSRRTSTRRGVGRREQPVDLAAPAALVAATVFGLVGVGMTGYGVDRAVIGTGSGQWLSAGLVALAVAAGYLVALWRSLTTTR